MQYVQPVILLDAAHLVKLVYGGALCIAFGTFRHQGSLSDWILNHMQHKTCMETWLDNISHNAT